MEGESFPIIRESLKSEGRFSDSRHRAAACVNLLCRSTLSTMSSSRQLFGGSLEKVEGLGGFRGDGLGSFFELVGDFEEACGVRGKRGGCLAMLFQSMVPLPGQR